MTAASNLIGVMTIGGVLLVIGSSLAGGCIDIHLKEPAEAAARNWLEAVGIKGRVTCVNSDSDGDGYVTCTVVSTEGKLTAIECVGASYTYNEGCRIPKPSIRTIGGQ